MNAEELRTLQIAQSFAEEYTKLLRMLKTPDEGDQAAAMLQRTLGGALETWRAHEYVAPLLSQVRGVMQENERNGNGDENDGLKHLEKLLISMGGRRRG